MFEFNQFFFTRTRCFVKEKERNVDKCAIARYGDLKRKDSFVVKALVMGVRNHAVGIGTVRSNGDKTVRNITRRCCGTS